MGLVHSGKYSELDERYYNNIINLCFQKELSFQFYNYNPFDETTIRSFGDYILRDINNRALHIIAPKGFKELNQAILNFKDVLIVASELMESLYRDVIHGDDLLSDAPYLVNTFIDSDIFIHKAIFGEEDLLEAKPKIYALLAIYLIGSVCNAHIDIKRTRSEEYLAICAMEAVCNAEKYSNIQTIKHEHQKLTEEQIKNRMTERGRNASKERHAKTNQIKQDILKEWKEYKQTAKHPSKNQFSEKMAKKYGMNKNTIRKNWLQGNDI